MIIKDINLREIYDSRGESTLEVEVVSPYGVSFRAQVPSGKSRGRREVEVFNFAEARKSFDEIVKRQVIGGDFKTLADLDGFLIRLDGTERKKKIGGNLMLGISVTFTRALAHQAKQEVWEFLNEEFFGYGDVKKQPLIFSNFIEGGAHAHTSLTLQEYLVVAKNKKPAGAVIKDLLLLYKILGEFLEEKYGAPMPLGDEGGYTIRSKDNFEPVKILEQLIETLHLQDKVWLGLDAAASHFYKKEKYTFNRKKLSTTALMKTYVNYFKKSELLYSIEDPFAEEDYEGFKKLNSALNSKLIIGDDLTVTNPALIRKYGEGRLIGGVIIKPNQIGTVTETCEAIRAAKRNNLKVIVSHRSGEVEDTFVIHVAKASGADGLKIGAPARERLAKFNEFLRLYEREEGVDNQS